MSDNNYTLTMKVNQLLRQNGTYNLAELRTILRLKCSQPLDSLIEREDFRFVPRSHGSHPLLALCVGRVAIGPSRKDGPGLYIVDLSDGKTHAPDIHCQADTDLYEGLSSLQDLDRYVRTYKVKANEFWTKVLQRDIHGVGTSNFDPSSRKFRDVFQFVQMLCGHRENFVGNLFLLIEALNRLGKGKGIQAEKRRLVRKDLQKLITLLSEGVDAYRALHAGDRPRTQHAQEADGTPARPQDSLATTSTTTEKRILEAEDGQTDTNKRARCGSLQDDTQRP